MNKKLGLTGKIFLGLLLGIIIGLLLKILPSGFIKF